jgi:hypothetical protein
MLPLYHIALADFLERVRRSSFLVTLLVVVAVTYFYLPALDAQLYPYLNMGGYRPIYNSAWIGVATALLMAEFFPLFGFYLVKNAIERDRRTSVGEIIATTPLSKAAYLLGKWLSNLAVFVAILLVIALAALVLQLIRAEDLRLDPLAILAPLFIINLPIMAVMAALAVLFESVATLRGGFGNLVYYIVYSILSIIGDLQGQQAAWPSIYRACAALFDRCNPNRQIDLDGFPLTSLPTFTFEGVAWTAEIILARLAWVLFALAIAWLTSLFFHRFDPSKVGQDIFETWKRALLQFVTAPKPESAPELATEADAPKPAPVTVSLSSLPLSAHTANFSLYLNMLFAELRLTLKGLPIFWHITAAGLILANALLPLDLARLVSLPLAWVWPVLLWANLGAREIAFHTNPLLFSVPYPLRRQLPIVWLSGFIITLVMGLPILARLLLAGNQPAFGATLVGAFFIPSLALAMGCWSGTPKLFQAIYIFAWYLAAVQGVTSLDFMGHLPIIETTSLPLVYFALTILCLAAAVLGRQRQLRQK